MPMSTRPTLRLLTSGMLLAGLAATWAQGDFGGQLGPDDSISWRMSLDTGIVLTGQPSFLQDVLLSAGDINKDGRDDILVGSQSSGTVTVRSGSDGSVLLQFTGDPSKGFGQSVGPAGDINNDGFDDILIGEPGFLTGDGQVGRVLAVSGSKGTTLLQILGDLAGDETGFSVHGVGDINGDGHADFGVGSPGVSRVRVHSGATGGVLLDIKESLPPTAIGQLVRGAGDVDGDGTPDILISLLDTQAPELERSARVVSGADGLELFTVAAGPGNLQLDLSMDAPGDMNGDGLGDIAVLLRDEPLPRIGIFAGPDGQLIDELELIPSVFNPYIPTLVDVAAAGDVDGDGHPDILAATLKDFVGGYAVYSGATGTLLRLGQFLGAPHAVLRAAVAPAGDVNGDGYDDLLLGLHQLSSALPTLPSTGRVLFGGDPWFIRLGDRLRDELTVGAVDIVRFEAIAGSQLTLSMKSVGSNKFSPGFSLTAPSGLVPLPPEADDGLGRTARLRKFSLPDTGSYVLTLGTGLSQFADAGRYTLRTKVRTAAGKGAVVAGLAGDPPVPFLPGNKVLGEVTTQEGAPASIAVRVSVDLSAGSRLTLRARPLKGSDLQAALRVLDPDGAELSLDGVSPAPDRIQKLIVPVTGTYIVEVLGLEGSGGPFSLKTKARTPRGTARILAPTSLDLF